MLRKIFIICAAIVLLSANAAAAKDKGLPEEDRIKIAVEITNSSRYKDLPTSQLMEDFLTARLLEKNFVNVLGSKILDEIKPFAEEPVRDEETADDTNPAENIGQMLVFDVVEIPATARKPENFDADAYKTLGADYVVRCEVLGLGATKVDNKAIGTVTGIIGGGLGFSGSGSSDRDKTLRRVGTGVGLLGFIGMADFTKRTALNTVVNIQFISVETGEIVWQEHFIGQATKHHKPGKNFTNAWEQAYSESVDASAKLAAKRVNKYVDKVIVKGKSDKSFLPKKIPFGKGLF